MRPHLRHAPGGSIHGWFMVSFHLPCRFAGCAPTREPEISRYRPYWKNSAARPGSFPDLYRSFAEPFST